MDILPISLVGGLLALDTTAVMQVLISQPLVSGTILGWLLGDVTLGLHIGILLQFLWLNQLPVGAAKIPEGNLASVIAVILVFRLEMFLDAKYNMLILAVILYTLFISYIGTLLITQLRKWNILFLDRVSKLLDEGYVCSLGQINMMALLMHLGVITGAILISVLFGEQLLSKVISAIPENWNATARYVEIAIIGSGIGLALNFYRDRKNWRFLFLGFILGIGLYCLV